MVGEKEIIAYLADKVQDRFSFKTKREARKMLFEAIIYDVVIEGILDQIEFLLNYPDDEDSAE